MKTALELANDRIGEISDISEDDLFVEERHMLALHDERNRLTVENNTLRAEVAKTIYVGGLYPTVFDEVAALRVEGDRLRAEIERWRDSNIRLRSEMEHQAALRQEQWHRAEVAEAALREIATLQDQWPQWEFRCLYEASRDAARAALAGKGEK